MPAELGEVTAGLLTSEDGDTVLVVIGEGERGGQGVVGGEWAAGDGS
jgi:hypothetical protein